VPIVCWGYISTYTGSKGYLTALSRSLAAELADKIDVLAVAPSTTITNMTKNVKTDIFTATAEECVRGSLKELGRGDFTYGAWRHSLKFNLFDVKYERRAANKEFRELALANS